MEKVLITGGTGLLGTAITDLLISKGYEVAHLSRKPSKKGIRTFLWDVDAGIIEPDAISFADHIIHLAGASVFEKRWTDAYKKEMIDSRIKSTQLLENALSAAHVKSFISASAIGYYGIDTNDKWLDENSPRGDGFLADLTVAWENAVEKISSTGIRVVTLRVGIVLSPQGGALVEMVKPVKYYVGSPLGSGKQYVSWIHIADLAAIFEYSLRNNAMKGPYNVAASEPLTNAALTRVIGKVLNKPVFLPPLPGFVLGLILGQEKAKMVTGGNRVSNARLKSSGFIFQYDNPENAIKSLLKGSF